MAFHRPNDGDYLGISSRKYPESVSNAVSLEQALSDSGLTLLQWGKEGLASLDNFAIITDGIKFGIIGSFRSDGRTDFKYLKYGIANFLQNPFDQFDTVEEAWGYRVDL